MILKLNLSKTELPCDGYNPLYPKLYPLSFIPPLLASGLRNMKEKQGVPENKLKQLLIREVGGCRNKGKATKKQWLSYKTDF